MHVTVQVATGAACVPRQRGPPTVDRSGIRRVTDDPATESIVHSGGDAVTVG